MTTTDIVQLSTQDQTNYAGQSLLQMAIRRLKRDRLTLLALAILIVLISLSIFATPIADGILRVNYRFSNPNSAFVPPGGTERLVYLPDFRYRPGNMYTVAMVDRSKNIGEVTFETRFDAIKADQGGLRVINAGAETPPLIAAIEGQPRPFTNRLNRSEVTDLQTLPAGKVNLIIREFGQPADAAPLFTLNDLDLAAGTLTVVAIAKVGEGAAPIVARQAVADLTKDQARLHVIHASLNAPTIHGFQGTDRIISDLPYGQTAAANVPIGTFMTGLGATNAQVHILGTDDLGRDHLAQLLHAGRVSLGIAVSAAMIAIFIGVTLGIIMGFYGGVIDDLMVYAITTIGSLPTLLLLLIIVNVIGRPTPTIFILVLGLLGWLGTARLVRGETFSIRAREYIVGARAIGAPVSRIMFVHILPNLLSVVIVTLALDIGSLILTESALAFLGFGLEDPPSWGNMLSKSQTYFTKGGYLVVFPGLLITITVLCLYVIGDGLRDAFDPTLKNN